MALGIPSAASADTPAPWGADQARPMTPGGEAAPEPSVAAAGSTATPTWRLSGAGWGHGVGMSQYGAREMAAAGHDARAILAHYYTGTDYAKRTDDQLLYVNLRDGVTSTTLTPTALASGGGTLTVISGKVRTYAPAGAVVTVSPSGSGVRVSCSSCTPETSLTGSTAALYWDDGKTLLSVDGTRYRDGSAVVTRTPGLSTLEVVARVRLHDEYLDYIREVPWSWPAAALEAQAAAARGYAIRAYSGGLKSTCNCHVYDTTASQVFGGYPSGADLTYWAAWRAAVRAAGSADQGFVALYDGSIIESVYSSSTGGRTQNSEDVWTAVVPYLRSVDDPWSLTAANPRSAWEFRPSQTSVASAFGLGDLVRLDLSSRYVSGAVRSATATSSTGAQATITGARLASRLGLYSTYVQRPTQRFDGANRYAVAASVAAARTSAATTVVIASGETQARADAAVSGPLSQALGAPLLLTTGDALPSATRSELDRRADTLTQAVVVGGSSTVSDAVVDELSSRGLTVTRLGGANRYALSATVARKIAQLRTVTAAVVASGSALADALGAGGPSGKVGEPILLTRQDELPTQVAGAIADLSVRAVRIVGGTASVSSGVEAELDARVDSVIRIGGSDRYEVAAAVGAYYAPRLSSVTVVSLASGTDAALTDALTAGSLGRITLLVRASGVPDVTAEALQRQPDLKRLDVIGGPASVPEGVRVAAARS